jgi:hypothetical protein
VNACSRRLEQAVHHAGELGELVTTIADGKPLVEVRRADLGRHARS